MSDVKRQRINFKFITASVLLLMLLLSLDLMSAAIQNATKFNKLFSTLLWINITGLVILVVMIGVSISRLLSQYYRQAPGSRLSLKLVAIFAAITFIPSAVVYYFSLDFLRQGIDSWFDVRIESALGDALDLGRASLDSRMREARKLTEGMAEELDLLPNRPLPLVLNDLRDHSGASEITLLSESGRLLGSSSADASILVPDLPNEALLLHVRQVKSYVGLDAIRDQGLHMRVLVHNPSPGFDNDGTILQALFPVAQRLNTLAENVQNAYVDYRELAYMRPHLKNGLILTLSMVLLLSLLGAFWAAIYSARQMVAPIRHLAEGTRAVAAGQYDKKIPFPGNDELGFLVESFNDMTKRIALARDEASRSQLQAENQRAYLEVVLGSLSTGVLTLDADQSLRTVNEAAVQILQKELRECVGHNLRAIEDLHPSLQAFCRTIATQLARQCGYWAEQISMIGESGHQVLMCRGSALPSVGLQPAGFVIVFDDITELLRAQREAAWGEVARRLAHEIKNPLTPIQLSAERLRHKYLHAMAEQDAKILDRSTHTIIQQVEAMKEMVKAFNEYALAPKLKLVLLDVNAIVREVLDLYHAEEHPIIIHSQLAKDLPLIEADVGRIRQLLHNLIKNAQEALGHQDYGEITITTAAVRHNGKGWDTVELHVQDSGPGIPTDILDRLFEPYVTTKIKGSGLGLAIVKKIVEEHGGNIFAENLQDSGARLVIRLPVPEAQTKMEHINESIV